VGNFIYSRFYVILPGETEHRCRTRGKASAEVTGKMSPELVAIRLISGVLVEHSIVINTTSAPSDMYTAMPRTVTIPVSDTDVFKHNL